MGKIEDKKISNQVKLGPPPHGIVQKGSCTISHFFPWKNKLVKQWHMDDFSAFGKDADSEKLGSLFIRVTVKENDEIDCQIKL